MCVLYIYLDFSIDLENNAATWDTGVSVVQQALRLTDDRTNCITILPAIITQKCLNLCTLPQLITLCHYIDGLSGPEKLEDEAFGEKEMSDESSMFRANNIIAVNTDNRAMVNVVTFIS